MDEGPNTDGMNNMDGNEMNLPMTNYPFGRDFAQGDNSDHFLNYNFNNQPKIQGSNTNYRNMNANFKYGGNNINDLFSLNNLGNMGNLLNSNTNKQNNYNFNNNANNKNFFELDGMNNMNVNNMTNHNIGLFQQFNQNNNNNQNLFQQQMNLGNSNNIDSLVQNLNPEDYLFEKFGKKGWQCEDCNNFNFETRQKCNKCHIPIKPKLVNKNKREELGMGDDKKKKQLKERKGDWICTNCRNLNFTFR